MQQIEMTTAQFNAEILEMTGWKCPVCEKGGLAHYFEMPEPEHWKEYPEIAWPKWVSLGLWPCRGTVDGHYTRDTLDLLTEEIALAKALTDELIKERKWVRVTTIIEGHDVEPTTRVEVFWNERDEINLRDVDKRIECFATGTYHEELARSMAYYEARTGKRVVIVDG